MWQPKDHSLKFMRHLRNYSAGDLQKINHLTGVVSSSSVPKGLRNLDLIKDDGKIGHKFL